MSERTLKRYAVFSGSLYYPAGGWDDFTAAFDHLEDAVLEMKLRLSEWGDWAHVVDLWTGEQDPQDTAKPTTVE